MTPTETQVQAKLNLKQVHNIPKWIPLTVSSFTPMMNCIYNCIMCLPSGRRTEQSLRSPYESGFSMTVSNRITDLIPHTLQLSLWPFTTGGSLSLIVRLMKAGVLIVLAWWMCDYMFQEIDPDKDFTIPRPQTTNYREPYDEY